MYVVQIAKPVLARAKPMKSAVQDMEPVAVAALEDEVNREKVSAAELDCVKGSVCGVLYHPECVWCPVTGRNTNWYGSCTMCERLERRDAGIAEPVVCVCNRLSSESCPLALNWDSVEKRYRRK